MSNFLFCGGREQKATTCFFFPWILLEFNFSKNCQHLTNWTRWNKRYKVWGSVTSLFKWRFRSRGHRCCLRFPRGGEVLKKCLYKEARPVVRPVTLVYSIFHENVTPFVYLLLKSGTPFTSVRPCIPLTAVRLNRTFSRLYKAIQFICWPFHRPKWQISLPFYILQLVKSLPFHTFVRILHAFNCC